MQQSVFKHVGIVGKYRVNHVEDTIKRLIDLLGALDVVYTLDQRTMPERLREHPRALPIKQWSTEIDLCVVIGGDGTFLYAGRQLVNQSIPIVGINAGRLGFLADIPSDTLEQALSTILSGHYSSELRHTLHVSIDNQERVRACYHAVNDVVIHKRNVARMIEIDVYTRERFLSHYRADGLIIATPTGSTAYALSAGGPIVEPSLSATLVVPICPHTLTQRPVVLDARRVIRACVSNVHVDEVLITIDGQESEQMQRDDQIVIQQGPTLNVIHPANYNFQHRLREKLNWGVAPIQGVDQGNDHA